MSKRYYEHEDRNGKKFYSENPNDPESKEYTGGDGGLEDYILIIALATGALIICPIILDFIHTMCFGQGFSWGSLIGYLVLLALIYGLFGWFFGATIVNNTFDEKKSVQIAITIAYIISLIVLFLISSDGTFFQKWYDFVLSGVFAYILTLDGFVSHIS